MSLDLGWIAWGASDGVTFVGAGVRERAGKERRRLRSGGCASYYYGKTERIDHRPCEYPHLRVTRPTTSPVANPTAWTTGTLGHAVLVNRGRPEKVARIFELVEGVLQRLAPERSATEIAKAAQALWSGVHDVCILGLTGRLAMEDGHCLEELVESLIVNCLEGFGRT